MSTIVYTGTESAFVKLLGGAKAIHQQLLSGFDLITLSNEGISKASFEALAGHIGISKKSFAEDILSISVKTVERKKSTERLDKRTSSHIIEIARVAEHAITVFEDEAKAIKWLNTPNRALNNLKPVELLSTYTGMGMVDDILGRIEEGVYS